MSTSITVTCELCGDPQPSFRWTDFHGIATCSRCGAPYRLLHYDEQHQPVDKAPTLLLKPDYVALAQQYWRQTHRNIQDDKSAFRAWIQTHEAGAA